MVLFLVLVIREDLLLEFSYTSDMVTNKLKDS